MVTAGRKRKAQGREGPAEERVVKRTKRSGKVFDTWYTPTVADVYAQLKVAEQMLSRINDPELATVKREMYLLEDMLWQFKDGT